MKFFKKTLKSKSGFTLVEIMVVLVLIASFGGIIIAVNDSERDLIKQEARYVVGMIRYAYNEAATNQLPYRLVFDFDKREYYLEEGAQGFKFETPQMKEEREKTIQDLDNEEELPPSFSEADSRYVKKRELEDVVYFKSFYNIYEPEGTSEGQAYIYFFPGGRTQLAMIQFTNEEGDINYSVMVNPITGQSKVRSELVDFDSLINP
jgi:prepilin-type N-terminal cleavage/methylation domain-containing protein